MKALFVSFVLFMFSGISLFAMKTTPPDTTSNIIDKSSSVFLIEEAKHFYAEGKLKDAMALFKSIEVNDPESWKASYWVGMCYYKLNNYTMSLKHAQLARKKDSDVSGELYELLGKSYHQNELLDSAIVNYTKALDKLSKQRADELRIFNKIEECKFARLEIRSNRPRARKLLNMEVNSDFNEYAPLLTNNGKTLYFAGRRSNTTGGLKNPDDEQYFEDVYRAVWNDKFLMWDSVTNDLGKMNGQGFEALTYVNNQENYGLLTLNTTALDIESTTQSSDICEVEKKNGVWGRPKMINNETINSSYYDGAATMSADGTTMIFVSDRNGEKSSTDLFIVRRKGKKWGEAEVLPVNVNTVGRETTPFLSPDGKYLFFSSDGHKGMGGYDIYVTQNYGNSWSTPINLGASINTVNDDTHFHYYPELKRALMAGITLDEMQCNYNIYEVDLDKVTLPLK
jgi:tetratricopeptide (TPR) repeat protein